MAFARTVKSPQRLNRMITAKINGTGTASKSGTCANNITLVDNGTGDYTLSFERFARVPEVIVTTQTATTVARLGTVTESSVQILTQNMSSAATDAIFHVMIIGSDAEAI